MGTLVERGELRNRHHLFAERREAGRYLSTMMEEFRGAADCLVLAVPSGGVPVGLELAGALGLPLDLLIVRKLQVPGNTESGFGAVTLGGTVFINEALRRQLDLSDEQVEAETARVRRELETRNTLFRNNRPAPDLRDRIVVLTDDGLASGFTMLAAVSLAADLGAGSVIVAVPTAPRSAVARLLPRVDRIFCPNVQDYGSFAVAAAYRRWRDLDPDEVITLLRRAEQRDGGKIFPE